MKNRWKRLLSMLLAMAMCLSLLAFPASAETTSGTCGENLTWTLDNRVLTISGTGDMTDYENGSAPWYSDSESITSVVIEDGVTSIGAYAFAECYNMTSVTIPDSVTSIGEGAFWDCSGLTGVTIPSGVNSIGKYAFYYCCELTSVTIPEGVNSIAEGAFKDCSGMTSITIPEGVTSIGNFAFWNCDNLADIYYGGSEWNAVSIGIVNEPLSNASIHYLNGGAGGENLTWKLNNGVLTISGTGAMTDYENGSAPGIPIVNRSHLL